MMRPCSLGLGMWGFSSLVCSILIGGFHYFFSYGFFYNLQFTRTFSILLLNSGYPYKEMCNSMMTTTTSSLPIILPTPTHSPTPMHYMPVSPLSIFHDDDNTSRRSDDPTRFARPRAKLFTVIGVHRPPLGGGDVADGNAGALLSKGAAPTTPSLLQQRNLRPAHVVHDQYSKA
jgi:hypothetical protein